MQGKMTRSGVTPYVFRELLRDLRVVAVPRPRGPSANPSTLTPGLPPILTTTLLGNNTSMAIQFDGKIGRDSVVNPRWRDYTVAKLV
jgi:hypothetical protein